jgi:CubicO group peptidase (beta-lactamase class C family)
MVTYVPGSRQAYSGGAYEIVQALVEDVTREFLATAMHRLLFGPADMDNSSFDQASQLLGASGANGS